MNSSATSSHTTIHSFNSFVKSVETSTNTEIKYSFNAHNHIHNHSSSKESKMNPNPHWTDNHHTVFVGDEYGTVFCIEELPVPFCDWGDEILNCEPPKRPRSPFDWELEEEADMMRDSYDNTIRTRFMPGYSRLSGKQLAVFEKLDQQLDREPPRNKRFKEYFRLREHMSRMFEFPVNRPPHRLHSSMGLIPSPDKKEFRAWYSGLRLLRSRSNQDLGWWHFDENFNSY